jgi:peptidoglycan-associated lipoprotein
MTKSTAVVLASFSIVVAFFLTAGCAKKKPLPVVLAPPPPAAETPKPVPALSLSVSPATIQKGQTAMLTWSAQHAASVNIDGNVGHVALSGSRSISPDSSTTYTAVAEGPGGRATASARVTVLNPEPATVPPPRSITDAEFFRERVSDVFFDFDSYDLRGDARDTLDRNHIALSDRPKIRLLIEGHCDERGSERYNLALGDRRAQAAKQYLVSRGILDARIDTLAYGEERPFETGHNEESWAKNRRAHFLLKGTLSTGPAINHGSKEWVWRSK